VRAVNGEPNLVPWLAFAGTCVTAIVAIVTALLSFANNRQITAVHTIVNSQKTAADKMLVDQSAEIKALGDTIRQMQQQLHEVGAVVPAPKKESP
jgi:ferredoxin-NADP reductase